MNLDYTVIFAYIAGIIILFVLARILLIPMKAVMKLFYNTIIGGIVLVIINLIGSLFGFHIAVNIATALIVGMLGVPGLILVIILKFLF